MLFYIGFLLCILGLTMVVKKTFDDKNILSPHIFLFAGILLYLYIPAFLLNSSHIYNSTYNLCLLVGVIGCFIACHAIPYNLLDKNIQGCIYRPKIRFFQLGAYCYIVYLLFGISKVIITYGLFGAFEVNRLDNHLGNAMLENSVVSLALTEGLKIFFYIYLAYIYSKGKKKIFYILYFIPMIHHRFTAVTRYDFVALAGALVIFVIDEKLYQRKISPDENKKKKKVNFFRIAVIGIIGIYLAMVFMRVANYTRFGEKAAGIDLSVISLFRNTISNDSLYYEYFFTLYNSIVSGGQRLEYGMSWLIYPIMNCIPRSLWPGKPYTAFSARWTDKLYWGLTSGNPVVTFSILGEGYAQFGIVGCLISPMIFMWSRWINFKTVKKFEYSSLYTLVILFSLLTYMRSEAPVFLAFLDQFFLILIRTFCMRKEYLCEKN